MENNRLLYLSCHAVLEYNELKLFTELGMDIYSYGGAYRDPKGHSILKRPGIEKMNYYPEIDKIAQASPKTEIPQEIIDQFDWIIVMGGIGDVEILTENWPRIKDKKVVWRTIGQTLSWQERALKPLRDQGLKIVRYSPKEKNIPDYLGQDVVIRFYEDQEEFKGWNGGVKQVINVTQSLRGRGNNCFYDLITQVLSGFPAKIYGSGNDDLGNLNGGELPFDLLKGQLRDNRVFFYTGTWPACYTLSFVEAMMTGIPIVTITKRLFAEKFKQVMDVDIFEVPEIIKHGESGFTADTINEARSYLQELLDDGDLAAKIGEKARRGAVELFGKDKIKEQWKEFFK